jgi:hypothetical protein
MLKFCYIVVMEKMYKSTMLISLYVVLVDRCRSTYMSLDYVCQSISGW